MTRAPLSSFVVFVAAFTMAQTGVALAEAPHQFPDAVSQSGARNAPGERDGDQVPRRGAVLINGKLVPADQFGIDEAEDETCDERHLHPQNGSSVTAFDGTVIPDTDPWGCGYGKISEKKPYWVFDVPLQDEDFDGMPAILDMDDHNPDRDEDGVPDGAEDVDGDGLSNAFEIWVSKTNPANQWSCGNGNDDSTNYVLDTWKLRHVTIPVIINIYPGASNSPKGAIDNANKVLKKARVRLQVAAVRYTTAGDDGSGGGVANDGTLTEEEFSKAVKIGRVELATSPWKRGLKIILAEFDPNGQYTAGAAMRRVPVIAAATFTRNDKEIGGSIAHEFFHYATIVGHPLPGSPEDTPGNVMTPHDEGRDAFINSSDPDQGIENVTYTDGQLEFVWGDRIPSLFGRPGTRKSPAVKREYQRGSAVDELGDSTGPDYLDLHTIDMASHTDDEDIRMLLKLGDLFPDTGDVDAVYRLRFDIDDDPLTGEIGVIPGIDRTITIFVERTAGTTDLVVGAEVSFADPLGSALLAPVPQLLTVERIADRATIPNLPTAAIFELHVPKDLLGMTAANVPGTVESFASATSFAADLVLVDFDRDLWLDDPTLSIPVEFADRDELVPFSLTGMTPGDSYELFLDDTLVHAGTLDGSGDDSASFTVPAAQPDDFCFLTAVDDTGMLAASAVVVPRKIFEDGFETGNTSLWASVVP